MLPNGFAMINFEVGAGTRRYRNQVSPPGPTRS